MRRSRTEKTIALGGGRTVAVCVHGATPPRDVPLVLHLHGGAFQARLPACSDAVPALLAEAGAVVVSADYPSGADCPFPVALEAAYAVLQHLHAKRTRLAGRNAAVFVAGEESGGNLAAALALLARDRHGPPLAGQILLSPMLDPTLATCSARGAKAGAVGCKWADGWRAYLGTPEKASHPYAAPAMASRLAGLPPALVLTAEDDPMLDESRRYAARLREAGVTVDLRTIPAPTGWPDALIQASTARPCWMAALRTAFATFLAASVPALAGQVP